MFSPDTDQQVMQAVASGRTDLGYVYAADTGVPALGLFATPMLSDSYALQREVLASDLDERASKRVSSATGH